MRCSTCGAQVGVFDRSCAACGADVAGMPPTPVTARAEVAMREEASVVVAGVDTPKGTRAPVRRRRVRWTAIVVAAAVIAVAIAGILGASRADLADRLTTTDAELSASRGALADAEVQIDELTQQVTQLEDARDTVQSQLDDATAAQKNVQRSLTACQDLFRGASKLMGGGKPSRQEQVRLASQLVTCFEGEVPPSLFP